MEIAELIKHPERLDRDTLYELRSMLALYPYFQTARLLMLQNLYLLHDPSFDTELRRAAIYITDRRVLFQMIEAAHYQLRKSSETTTTTQAGKGKATADTSTRTLSLIDNFLDSIPKENEPETDKKKAKRKPTPADAAVDYVAYLLECEDYQEEDSVPRLKGQSLIDSFINNDTGKIVLPETPTLRPELEEDSTEEGKAAGEDYFTEALARIYIKQGNYSKALEIIQRLSLDYPKKNAYFADQIRFLEKLIINNNKNKK
ncbi:tetratricopeptide repeat protein [Xylanibacter brevis]|uniref:tetratricopeptide repeat protein n=1 Tax=Xylanibacter brevis TaxID=83231 RepID=UPI000484CC23|nr:tetratricopeptide repeat protein [Xylanibacter brevis]